MLDEMWRYLEWGDNFGLGSWEREMWAANEDLSHILKVVIEIQG